MGAPKKMKVKKKPTPPNIHRIKLPDGRGPSSGKKAKSRRPNYHTVIKAAMGWTMG